MDADGLDFGERWAAFDARAARFDGIDTLQAGAAYRRLGGVEAIGNRSNALDRAIGARPIVPDEDMNGVLHVASAARQQADGVEAGCERHRAGARNEAMGRLPGGYAAAMGGNSQRAGRVGAERDDDAAARNGCRRARRRSASHEVGVPRIAHATARVVVTRRLIGKFGQGGESDAPRAVAIEPRQQVGFAVDGNVRRGCKAPGRPTRRRSKYILGGIGEPAELAVDAWKTILDAHKRVEAWFEPPRALRRSQAHFATRSCVERRPIRNAGAS